jgi:acyl dehydratase
VLAGDTIVARATIAGLRRSRHHPERGIMELDLMVANQRGEAVMTMSLANLVEARAPEAAA